MRSDSVGRIGEVDLVVNLGLTNGGMASIEPVRCRRGACGKEVLAGDSTGRTLMLAGFGAGIGRLLAGSAGVLVAEGLDRETRVGVVRAANSEVSLELPSLLAAILAAMALKESGDRARVGEAAVEVVGVCSRSKCDRSEDTGFYNQVSQQKLRIAVTSVKMVLYRSLACFVTIDAAHVGSDSSLGRGFDDMMLPERIFASTICSTS